MKNYAGNWSVALPAEKPASLVEQVNNCLTHLSVKLVPGIPRIDYCGICPEYWGAASMALFA